MTKKRGTGDGDVCPLNPEHGQMFFLTKQQYCPDASHEGTWTREGKQPPSRKFWPQGHDSFRRAVASETLPEIDIALLGG